MSMLGDRSSVQKDFNGPELQTEQEIKIVKDKCKIFWSFKLANEQNRLRVIRLNSDRGGRPTLKSQSWELASDRKQNMSHYFYQSNKNQNECDSSNISKSICLRKNNFEEQRPSLFI